MLQYQIDKFTKDYPNTRYQVQIKISPIDDPEPEVRFMDFGESALQFSLLFWLDAEKVQRDPLASDLRFMIDRAFADAGLSSTPLAVSTRTDAAGQFLLPLAKPGTVYLRARKSYGGDCR